MSAMGYGATVGQAASLLGLVLAFFGFAPASTYVNCYARRPS